MEKIFIANIRGDLFKKWYKKELIKYLILMPLFLFGFNALMILGSKSKDHLYLSIFLSLVGILLGIFGFFQIVKHVNNTIKYIKIDYKNEMFLFKTYETFLKKEKTIECGFMNFFLEREEFNIHKPRKVTGWYITNKDIQLRLIDDFFVEEVIEEITKLKKN